MGEAERCPRPLWVEWVYFKELFKSVSEAVLIYGLCRGISVLWFVLE